MPRSLEVDVAGSGQEEQRRNGQRGRDDGLSGRIGETVKARTPTQPRHQPDDKSTRAVGGRGEAEPTRARQSAWRDKLEIPIAVGIFLAFAVGIGLLCDLGQYLETRKTLTADERNSLLDAYHGSKGNERVRYWYDLAHTYDKSLFHELKGDLMSRGDPELATAFLLAQNSLGVIHGTPYHEAGKRWATDNGYRIIVYRRGNSVSGYRLEKK